MGPPPDRCATYVMLRAAQVTLRDGYDWFRIVDRERAAIAPPRSRATVSVGIGGFSFGRHGGVGGGVGRRPRRIGDSGPVIGRLHRDSRGPWRSRRMPAPTTLARSTRNLRSPRAAPPTHP